VAVQFIGTDPAGGVRDPRAVGAEEELPVGAADGDSARPADMLNLVPAAAAGGVVGQAGVERHHGAVAVVDVQHAEVGAVQDGRRAAGRVVARDAQGRVAADRSREAATIWFDSIAATIWFDSSRSS